ncbi:MAG: tetratricopeptide repeat protein, partial [Bacillota bacterium]
LPAGSRLVLNRNVRVLGRPAVEATLMDAEPGQQATLVVDSDTGLILEATVQGTTGGGAAQKLVKAVRFDVGAAVTTVEYEAPVLGRLGRLTLARRPPGGWFVLEAVVGDEEEAHRLRFEQVQLGEAAGDLKRPDSSTLEELARLDSEARTLYREKRYAEAAQRFRALVRIDPYNVNAHNLLGNIAMETGDWVTASSEFDQVIHLAPESPLGYNNLAYLYTELGLSLSVALELAQKAMDLSGAQPHGAVLDTYGWALFHNGRAEEAVAVLERAVALSGDDPESQAEVLYHLGVVQLSLNRVEEARRLFTQALQLDPDLAKARQALGRLEQEKGQAAGP